MYGAVVGGRGGGAIDVYGALGGGKGGKQAQKWAYMTTQCKHEQMPVHSYLWLGNR